MTPPAVADGTLDNLTRGQLSHRSPAGEDTEKPRRLASLGEARAYVDVALRLGRPEAWREVYDRLRAVAGEEDALEAIGDLRELLELEDLLILPALPLEQRHRSPR